MYGSCSRGRRGNFCESVSNAMKTRAKVVVIGGVVVVSTLYHLASKGWGDDVVLIDRGAERGPVSLPFICRA